MDGGNETLKFNFFEKPLLLNEYFREKYVNILKLKFI